MICGRDALPQLHQNRIDHDKTNRTRACAASPVWSGDLLTQASEDAYCLTKEILSVRHVILAPPDHPRIDGEDDSTPFANVTNRSKFAIRQRTNSRNGREHITYKYNADPAWITNACMSPRHFSDAYIGDTRLFCLGDAVPAVSKLHHQRCPAAADLQWLAARRRVVMHAIPHRPPDVMITNSCKRFITEACITTALPVFRRAYYKCCFS